MKASMPELAVMWGGQVTVSIVVGLAGIGHQGRRHLGHVQDASPAQTDDHLELPLTRDLRRVFHHAGRRLRRVPALDVHLDIDRLRLQERERLLQDPRFFDVRPGHQEGPTGPQLLGLSAELMNGIHAEDDGGRGELNGLKHPRSPSACRVSLRPIMHPRLADGGAPAFAKGRII